MTARERMDSILDAGSEEILEIQSEPQDFLHFVDTKPYLERVHEAQIRTGMKSAALCARGKIHGSALILVVMDFRFLGGSLGSADGEAITRAAEIALADQVPFLIVSASGGARMQEGAMSLTQMAKTNQAIADLHQAGILTISVVTDPTYGGVAASHATACDIIISEPRARMGFAGPRVIAQILGQQQTPDEFQTAESLLRQGHIDGILPRPALRGVLAKFLAAAEMGSRGRFTNGIHDPVIRDTEQVPKREPWTSVELARKTNRPTTLDYVNFLIDGFQELHGDRVAGDCPAIVGGIGWLRSIPLIVIGNQKGHTLTELSERNFGMPSPAGYRKAARLMRLAEKLGLPVVTLIDTPGAYPGVEAEENGQASAISENLLLMSRLRVPTVAVITGEGGSGGALALGLANTVLMFSDAIYSVISPEGCAAILWKSREAAPEAAENLGLDAKELLRLEVVDGVLPEPRAGTEHDWRAAAIVLRDGIVGALDKLIPMDPETLCRQRKERFRRLGTKGV